MIDEKRSHEQELLRKDKQMLKIHILYLAIIFVLLAIFLILIAPNTVNPKAFENFSFTSSIVSIVLAVVSIVYSFRTKSSSSDNIAGMREIERNIESRIQKFDSFKTELVEEVRGITRPIETEVSNIRLGQVEASNQMKQMLEQMYQKEAGEEGDNGYLMGKTSFYGNVMMYILCSAMRTSKVVDLEKFNLDLKDNYDYLWGFLVALGALKGQPFIFEKTSHVLTVKKFDEAQLGDNTYWRSLVLEFGEKQEAEKYLSEIDAYFFGNEVGKPSVPNTVMSKE